MHIIISQHPTIHSQMEQWKAFAEKFYEQQELYFQNLDWTKRNGHQSCL